MELVYRLDDIRTAAERIIKEGQHSKVWAFYGDMGAGKTTLIHAVCELMGLQGSFGSPTFSIINEYFSGDFSVYHVDLYRCRNEEEAVRAGVEDCLYSGNLCMVEWPSKAEGIFPDDTLRLHIHVLDEFTRKIVIGTAGHNALT